MIRIGRYIGTIGLLLLLYLYFYSSEHIKRVDYQFYDFIVDFFYKYKQEDAGTYTVVVDIDEKSLQQLGQWPWPRIIDAELINNIENMNPSAIGVNILFPERDRSSPISIEKFYKFFFNLEVNFDTIPKNFKDNDKLLYDSIQQADATLSTYFNNSLYTAPHCEKLSYRQNMFSNIKSNFTALSLLCNHQSLQNGVENFGFINALADSDGVFRRVPLFMTYRGEVFPSFALSTLLSIDKNMEIDTKDNTILVDFSKKLKIISAIDILSGKIAIEEIQGKVVILGSSIVGLNPVYTTSRSKKVSNSMIHAFVIESLLEDTLLKQPEEYKRINLSLFFIFSILIILLFNKRLYTQIIILLFVTLIISSYWLLYRYINGIYISIGYFWIPSFYFFILTLLYHVNIIRKERQEQEKLLIRQNKLASMGEMIALIAHQWRQPLSAINGIVLSMDMDERKNLLNRDRLDEYLNMIEERTAYLSQTIGDFADFFSINKTRESFYISDVIKQTIQLSVTSENIDIEHRREENFELIGYRRELIQSLLVLINNSSYACRENLSNIEKGKIMIDTYLVDNKAFISVEDNGGGIDIKKSKKIFNPYFTTKPAQSGTGLGLYILKLIVEDSMNGKIHLTNGKDGAIFTIELPSRN
jgi:signal transduction histidine kinase